MSRLDIHHSQASCSKSLIHAILSWRAVADQVDWVSDKNERIRLQLSLSSSAVPVRKLQTTSLGWPASVEGDGGGIGYPLDVPLSLGTDSLESRIPSGSKSLHQHMQTVNLNVLLLDLLDQLGHGLVASLGSGTSRLFESCRSCTLSRDGVALGVCQGQDGVVHRGVDVEVVGAGLSVAQEAAVSAGAAKAVGAAHEVLSAQEAGGTRGLLLTVGRLGEGFHDQCGARSLAGVAVAGSGAGGLL